MKKTAMILTLVLLLACAPAWAAQMTQADAIAAAQKNLPDAVFDYGVRERDDGRYEWQLFFTQDDKLGTLEVSEESGEVRRVELFAKPAGSLTAGEAMALLAQKKGEGLEVTELDLDWDDSVLTYEGSATLGGKRYDFEMSTTGEIIEWERD